MNKIKLLSPVNGSILDIFCDGIKGYLNAKTEEEQAQYLALNSQKPFDKQIGTLSFEKVDDADSYRVYVCKNNDFKDNTFLVINETHVIPGFLLPNQKYYWKVEAIKNNEVIASSDTSFFITSGEHSIRQLNIEGLINTRDEGGYLTESGKRIKYELLYRGVCLNGVYNLKPQNNGLYIMNNILKWKTEIDFRTTNHDDIGLDGCCQTENFFNKNNIYLKAPFTTMLYIFPNWKQEFPIKREYDKNTKESFKKIFEIISKKENYPIYMHCNSGADRTGTIGYILLGLLGVSYKDLIIDFELTTFAYTSNHFRSFIKDGKFTEDGVCQDDDKNYIAFGKMNKYMMEHYGTGDNKISSAIQNYLIAEFDIPLEEIESFKKIMLE